MQTEMTVGARVRVNRPIEIFPIAIFQPGLTGTVVHIDPAASPNDIVWHVKLDEHFAGLDEWHNELQVWGGGAGDQADCTIDAFDLIEGSYVVILAACARFGTEERHAFPTPDAALLWLLGDACQAEEDEALRLLKGQTFDIGDVTYTLETKPA